MKYRLGLDVGTASCGLIAWSLDDKNPPQPLKLVYNSLDIWAEPVLPAKSGGVGEPKKAARRRARQARRLIQRRARRMRRIAHLASLLSLDKSVIGPDNGQNIHHLRAQAAEEKIELADLLRVLLRLAKNRGPSGDWVYAEPVTKAVKKAKQRKKDTVEVAAGDESIPEETNKNTEEEKKGIVAGVRKLEALMGEAAQKLGKPEITLGQYLHYRRKHGESVILGKPDNKLPLYLSRRMVEHEFQRIWETQTRFYPVLQDIGIRKQFFDAIFFQRPLKSPAPMVGRCPLEPTLPRAPTAQMAAQTFRIEKQIADLRWGMGRRQQRLSQEQKTSFENYLKIPNSLPKKANWVSRNCSRLWKRKGNPRQPGLVSTWIVPVVKASRETRPLLHSANSGWRASG